MSSNKSGIYRILNIINKKIYIGSAKNLKQRWLDHRKLLRYNKHSNKHLQNAWNKYGEKSFRFEVLENVGDLKELIKIEQYYIDYFDACNKEYGYNLAPKAGSTLGVKYSEESKRNISLSKKGKPSHRKGSKHTEEAKEKNKLAHIEMYKDETKHPWFGKHHTEESNEKNRQSHLGKSTWNKGIPRTQEVKDKIRKALTGKKQTSNGIKRGLQIPRETRLCSCGCNESFVVKITSPKKFILGHWSHFVKERIQREIRICACGCGETFKALPSKDFKFIYNHHSKLLKRVHGKIVKQKIF